MKKELTDGVMQAWSAEPFDVPQVVQAPAEKPRLHTWVAHLPQTQYNALKKAPTAKWEEVYALAKKIAAEKPPLQGKAAQYRVNRPVAAADITEAIRILCPPKEEEKQSPPKAGKGLLIATKEQVSASQYAPGLYVNLAKCEGAKILLITEELLYEIGYLEKEIEGE